MATAEVGAGPVVRAVFVGDVAGAPLRSVSRITAIPGTGLAGDRYARGVGAWSNHPRYGTSEVTFIEEETIAYVEATIGAQLVPGATRRNVVTANVRLLELIGCRFSIGTAEFEGERPCDPCAYLEGLLGARVREPLARDGGGLRARIVTAGEFAPGDRIVVR